MENVLSDIDEAMLVRDVMYISYPHMSFPVIWS